MFSATEAALPRFHIAGCSKTTFAFGAAASAPLNPLTRKSEAAPGAPATIPTLTSPSSPAALTCSARKPPIFAPVAPLSKTTAPATLLGSRTKSTELRKTGTSSPLALSTICAPDCTLTVCSTSASGLRASRSSPLETSAPTSSRELTSFSSAPSPRPAFRPLETHMLNSTELPLMKPTTGLSPPPPDAAVVPEPPSSSELLPQPAPSAAVAAAASVSAVRRRRDRLTISLLLRAGASGPRLDPSASGCPPAPTSRRSR